VSADNDGDEMWAKFVSKQKNVFLVLNGHMKTADGTGRWTAIGENGNLVNAMLSDYQSQNLGGEGYLRILRFKPAENKIEVSTYSPYMKAYRTDSHNQFTVPLRNESLPSATSVVGKARNISNCASLANATITLDSRTTTTASDGSYRFDIPAAFSSKATATASGYLSRSNPVAAFAGTTTISDFYLSTAGKIAGTVKDSSGSAVAGATVNLSGGVIETQKALTTDSLGTYQTGWIPIGNYSGTATASGSTSTANGTVVPGQTLTVDFTLSQTSTSQGSISGKVSNISNGLPISGANVSYAGGSTTTDSAGAYTLPNVVSGKSTLTVSRSGYLTSSRTVNVTSGANNVADFLLSTAGKLTGTVHLADGVTPVAGATITARGGKLYTEVSTTSSSTGSFTFSWIPVGAYTVTFSKTGLTDKQANTNISTGQTTTLQVNW
jgi:hypothetical protein